MWQHFLRFSDIKFRIVDAVAHCILARIIDCLRDDFHAVDLLRLARQEQGNRADSTVKIPDCLISGQSCIRKRLTVNIFRLNRIDLIKGLGRNCENKPADRILNAVFPADRPGFTAHDHICPLCIGIDRKAGHSGHLFKQPVRKLLLRRKRTAVENQADHNLSC